MRRPLPAPLVVLPAGLGSGREGGGELDDLRSMVDHTSSFPTDEDKLTRAASREKKKATTTKFFVGVFVEGWGDRSMLRATRVSGGGLLVRREIGRFVDLLTSETLPEDKRILRYWRDCQKMFQKRISLRFRCDRACAI